MERDDDEQEAGGRERRRGRRHGGHHPPTVVVVAPPPRAHALLLQLPSPPPTRVRTCLRHARARSAAGQQTPLLLERAAPARRRSLLRLCLLALLLLVRPRVLAFAGETRCGGGSTSRVAAFRTESRKRVNEKRGEREETGRAAASEGGVEPRKREDPGAHVQQEMAR